MTFFQDIKQRFIIIKGKILSLFKRNDNMGTKMSEQDSNIPQIDSNTEMRNCDIMSGNLEITNLLVKPAVYINNVALADINNLLLHKINNNNELSSNKDIAILQQKLRTQLQDNYYLFSVIHAERSKNLE